MYRSSAFLPTYARPDFLNIPQPHPDEHASSILARIMRSNGLSKISQLRQFDLSRLKHRSGCLPHLVGMTPEDFSTKHTCIPYLHFITHNRAIGMSTITGRSCLSRLWPLSAFRLPFVTAFYCSACTTEDTDLYGYSYWRTTHQFDIHACQKHLQGLIGLHVDPALVLPSDLMLPDRDLIADPIQSCIISQ